MTPEIPFSCSVIIKSTPTAIAKVWKDVQSKLEAGNYSPEDVFAVHLALEEAFINAVKHGNKMDPDKEVKVELSIEADKVEFAMTDEGAGFDPEFIPDPRCGENLYKIDGRGLLLMRSYMDVIEFNETGNRVHMVRYKDKERKGAGSKVQ